jgi:hypothetical protein
MEIITVIELFGLILFPSVIPNNPKNKIVFLTFSDCTLTTNPDNQ